MVNYSKSKIFKIEPNVEHDEEEIYIGTTTKDHLSQRMATIREDYRKYLKGKKYYIHCFKLFDKYGVENCSAILLENINAKTKDELKAKERVCITSSKCVNKIIPLRTEKQYKIDNKEKQNEQRKTYYENNKEKIKEYNKIYRETNKEKIKEMKRRYEEQNKDKIKERKQKYREKTKEAK